MTKHIPHTLEASSIYPWGKKSTVEARFPSADTSPIYEMGKKRFKFEMQQLDLFFKKAFAATDAKQLQNYLRTEKDILLPYYSLFDAYLNWITDEILTPSEARERGFVIKHAIKLAQYFYRSGNFQAYLITLSALQQQSIVRLKQSWACVPKKYDSWMKSEIGVSLRGDPGYLQKAMNNYNSPFFPHLLAYKTDYQKTLALYNEKSRDLEHNSSLQHELTELSARMTEISLLVSRMHAQLTSSVARAPLFPSSFVAGVQKWEDYFDSELEQRFVNRSKLLE